jgi:hypothetical protein
MKNCKIESTVDSIFIGIYLAISTMRAYIGGIRMRKSSPLNMLPYPGDLPGVDGQIRDVSPSGIQNNRLCQSKRVVLGKVIGTVKL